MTGSRRNVHKRGSEPQAAKRDHYLLLMALSARCQG
ncbi:hypothetical protein Ga0074812_1682 [Parafrankia irregularis]|uniref:Uncharacterized protein n=1 Tax=Parafrankia irregularis TaxID=795642 RepID=A0A0S4R070_9ACTN|nr:hypothetical protein Ga0074812_1682 [Parafrankia irregularis]